MRARSTYDKEGNSYRYQRAIKEEKNKEEVKASNKKWDNIYEGILPQPCSSSKNQP